MFRSPGPSDLCHLTPQRICIIKPSALGDVVQALPLLPILKTRFPAASITWVINRELKDLVVDHPHVDEVICFDRRGTWSNRWHVLRALRSRRFDLVFDLQGLLRSAVMTVATGARVRIGLQTAREGAFLATNCTIPDTGRNVPAHARLWRIAEVLGLANAPRRVQIATSAVEQSWAQSLLLSLPRPVVAVHPGAGWATKRWPIEKFASLLTRCTQTWGGSTILLGSFGERAEVGRLEGLLREAVGSIDSAALNLVNLAGQTTIKQLAELLTRVDLTISNDSGPMHLAAELGTPTLGLFTCTSATRSGPAGQQHELVSTTVDCAASYCKKCPNRGPQYLACLQELDVERAWHALRRLITKNQIPTSIRHAA